MYLLLRLKQLCSHHTEMQFEFLYVFGHVLEFKNVNTQLQFLKSQQQDDVLSDAVLPYRATNMCSKQLVRSHHKKECCDVSLYLLTTAM